MASDEEERAEVGSLWLIHDGIEIRAEWASGEALTVNQFVKALDAMTATWSALSASTRSRPRLRADIPGGRSAWLRRRRR